MSEPSERDRELKPKSEKTGRLSGAMRQIYEGYRDAKPMTETQGWAAIRWGMVCGWVLILGLLLFGH